MKNCQDCKKWTVCEFRRKISSALDDHRKWFSDAEVYPKMFAAAAAQCSHFEEKKRRKA